MKNYIDRTIVINEIKDILDSSTKVCIHGIGGIGKSTILQQYKNILEKDNNKIIYIDFDDEELFYYQAFFSKVSSIAADNGIELIKFNFALSICEKSIPDFEITIYKTKESKENLQDIYDFISACFQEVDIASKTIRLSKFIYNKYEEFKIEKKVSKDKETDKIFKKLFLLIEEIQDDIFDKNIEKISNILIKLLVIDLQDVKTNTKNYILIDTYEKFLSYPSKIMKNPPQLELLKMSTTPILIASRQSLSIDNFKNYSITGLTKMEVEKLLDKLDIIKEEERDYIYRCSSSNPYFIKALAVKVKKNPYDRVCLDINSDMLQNIFFKNFSIQEQETIKLLAYLDYFDEDIFKLLITKYLTGYPVTAFQKFINSDENYYVIQKPEGFAIHDNLSEYIQNDDNSKLLQNELAELLVEYYNYKQDYIKSFESASKPYRYWDNDDTETLNFKQGKIYNLIYDEKYITRIPFFRISEILFEYYQQRVLNIDTIEKLIVNLPILYFDRDVDYENNELIKALLTTNLDNTLIALLYVYLAGEVTTKAIHYLKTAERILIKEEILNNKDNMDKLFIIKNRLLLQIIRLELSKEFKKNSLEDFLLNFERGVNIENDKIFFNHSLVICELYKTSNIKHIETIAKNYLLKILEKRTSIYSFFCLYGVLLILEEIFISVPREIELIIFDLIRKDKYKESEQQQIFLYLFFIMYIFKKKDYRFDFLDYEKIDEAVSRYKKLMSQVVLLKEFSKENLEKILSNISLELELHKLNLNIENEIILFLKENQPECKLNYDKEDLYDLVNEAHIDEILELTNNYNYSTQYKEFQNDVYMLRIDREMENQEDYFDDYNHAEILNDSKEYYEYKLYKLNSLIKQKKEYEQEKSIIEKNFKEAEELSLILREEAAEELNNILEEPSGVDSQLDQADFDNFLEMLKKPDDIQAQIEDKLVEKTKNNSRLVQIVKKFYSFIFNKG